MEAIMHFGDMSEIGRLYVDRYGDSLSNLIAKTLKTVKTPYVIATTVAGSIVGTNEALAENGFTKCRIALNWHNSHLTRYYSIKNQAVGSAQGDHYIYLWMKKMKGNHSIEDKTQWTRKYHYSSHSSAAFTCGLGLWNGMHPNCIDGVIYPKQFFKLIRIPKEHLLMAKDELFLKENRMERILKTRLASWYVNGWKPEDWTEEMERKYWYDFENNKAK
jgi:hypothetical protein